MRKVYFLVAIAIGGAWYFKGSMTLLPDSHVQAAGWSLPSVPIGSEILGIVTSLFTGNGPTPPHVSSPTGTMGNTLYSAAQTVRPSAAKPVPAAGPAPNVQGAPTKGVDLGNVPPELVRFVTPALLTSTPSGTQDLSPVARFALQQIIVQARANPAAFREQLDVMARAPRGQQ